MLTNGLPPVNCSSVCQFLLAVFVAVTFFWTRGGAVNTDGHSTLPSHSESKHLMDKLMVNYSRRISPHGDSPTHVDLGIYINSFYSISEQTMDYSLNIYLRQQWYDPRLAFDIKELGGKKMLKLEENSWERLWVPDVFFRNEKRADFHMVTIPNRLMRLFSDGRIWYATKISTTLSCMMNLQKYPLDTQRCPMMLESFGHTMNTVIFRWLNKSVETEPNLSMPQFILIGTPVKDCSRNYTTGAYPCLQVDFVLKRDLGYFIIQVYIPTILIVILSWVAFWINTEAIPARVSLGLLTVLTMTTQSSGARASLPRVSYIKAIDVWMSVCLIFVFASLLEFAIVNVFSRKKTDTSKKRKPDPDLEAMVPMKAMMQKAGGMLMNGPIKPVVIEDKARKIDKISRRLFPLSFLLFNVIYWVLYTIVK